MSTTEVELVFEGTAVQQGRIDAQIFADSLSGCSEIFRRANALANGQASEATVLLESEFRSGSFIANLQLEQHLLESATNLITQHQFLTAAGLASIIGFVKKGRELGDSLIELWKWLKGRKPDQVTQTGNNTEITFGNNKKTVTNIVFNLYGDAAIRAAFGKATEPLRRGAVDRVAVRQGSTEQVAIDRQEAEFFEPQPWALEAGDTATEGARDAVLIVSKIAFKEGSTWTFFEQGATVIAKIDDEDFWQQVHDHTIKFGEGDRLRVRLHWEIEEKNGKLKQRNRIIKVYQVLDRPKQMRLDGSGGDGIQPVIRRKRNVSFDDV